MAATRAWDETQPPGSAFANTLDTIIQNLKIDVRERLNLQHVYGQNVTDDGTHRNIQILPAYMAPNASVLDAGGPKGFAASNGISGTVP